LFTLELVVRADLVAAGYGALLFGTHDAVGIAWAGSRLSGRRRGICWAGVVVCVVEVDVGVGVGVEEMRGDAFPF
jgi:hypothetical protein